METSIKLLEDEIKDAIVFYLENESRKIKKSNLSGEEGRPCIYLAQGGVPDSADPREHTFIYAECEVEYLV